MRFLFQQIIRIYWFLIPVYYRRNCLFRESCSRHVYRKLEEGGLGSGIKAFMLRYKQCRPGYKLEKMNGQVEMTLVDGTILKNEEISEHIQLSND